MALPDLRSRLERTASGNGEARSPRTGYGVVQPLEALALTADEMSEVGHVEERVGPANLPRERADLLADARRDAVWWGIAGGGALVVLLLLRPVLHRRR